jgi:dihydroxyacetone kinase
MAVVPIRRILDPAFAERYGVTAIKVVDDLTLEAVLAAATELDSPLIVQTSVKTVKSTGAKPFYSMWRGPRGRGAGTGVAASRPLPGLDMAGASLTLVKLDDELNDRFDAPAEVAARIFQW